MHPDEYERVAPYSELDRKPTESEQLMGDLIEEGNCDEFGCELGWDEHPLDWSAKRLCEWSIQQMRENYV